ncbi:MAG: hypothetical protein EOM18_00660 [Clostridia bacterium]|nr:hypothetical protein [Clostridia bacterium]
MSQEELKIGVSEKNPIETKTYVMCKMIGGIMLMGAEAWELFVSKLDLIEPQTKEGERKLRKYKRYFCQSATEIDISDNTIILPRVFVEAASLEKEKLEMLCVDDLDYGQIYVIYSGQESNEQEIIANYKRLLPMDEKRVRGYQEMGIQ